MITIKNENGEKEYHITEVNDARQILIGGNFVIVFCEGLEKVFIDDYDGEDFLEKVREYCNDMEIFAPYRQFVFGTKIEFF